jgi:hypothetical protein
MGEGKKIKGILFQRKRLNGGGKDTSQNKTYT